jgi:protein TonB
MFEQTLVSEGKTNISWTVLVAFGGELVLVTTLVLIPLIYRQALPRAQSTNAIFLAPPPPPPPPPSPRAALLRVAKVIPRPFVVGHLTAPVTVPKQVANLIEQEFGPPSEATALAGVPGGVPGGQIGGVIGGIVGSIPSAAPPPPPPSPVQNELAATPQRIRLGGDIQAGKLLYQVTPAYPPAARAVRVQGAVRLNAVVGKDGVVREITLVSGHPLLVRAAMQAAQQFMYRPTFLNGQAVEVDTVIVVQFHLTS